MLKSTKEFILSSEVKNKQGFRVRTQGIDITQFRKNPIMLFMHKRPTGERKDEVLPLGYWDDLNLKDGKLYGTPVFDDTDPFAVSIYNKVENGTIRMASAGLEPGEWSDDGVDQWLDKSVMVESSIVDRGSNQDSLSAKVALYDEENRLINLSDQQFTQFIKKQINSSEMKLIQLNEQTAKLLLLSDGATEADAFEAVQKLVTLADGQKQTIETQKGTIVTLNDKLTQAAEDLKKKETQLLADKIETYLEQAIEVDRKVLRADKPALVELADGRPDVLKKYLDKLPPNPTIKTTIEMADKSKSSIVLADLSWDQLDKGGMLVQLKADDLPLFKSKYQDKFKTEYKG